MSASHKNKTVGWIAGVAVVAAVVGVTGCSKETESDSGSKPAASSSSSSEASQPSQSSQPSGNRQATAEGAVAAWVTAVVKGQPKQACLVMAGPAKGSSPGPVGTPSRCASDEPDVRKMVENVGKLRESFTPKQSGGEPKVDVAKVQADGDKVEVPGDKITIDGQTLNKVVLSNSTGLKPGQLDVKIESAKIKDAWYVTNFNFDLG
ncbi:hypothetical protein ACH4TX_00740 [Streptomyces sp. NPDC021098]|uniref:hypothetical protein n=1 Tax=unclassified Streptomyces TaxID=2593676 RepID=UPI00379F353B